MQTLLKAIHPDLLAAQNLIYTPCGFTINQLTKEAESQEYGACTFEMNNQQIAFRVAKITPTKVGQFVTFWKRIGSGPIMPYDIIDTFDLLIISVRNATHFGQFVFPKTVLAEKGIVSTHGVGGKRAMRVYPPWDVTDNKQAKNTQAWQVKYFLQINPNTLEYTSVKKLFLS